MASAPGVTVSAMRHLEAYGWPGNIRELQNVIERALILCGGERLTFDSLSWQPSPVESKKAGPSRKVFPTMDEAIQRHIHEALALTQCKIEGPGGTAELLGMHPSTLRSRMKKYGIGVQKRTETV